MSSTSGQTASQLRSATTGFDYLFSNEIIDARKAFQSDGEQSPFHLLGLGVCAFLEAALGMEVCVPEAQITSETETCLDRWG
jgi:hypothetical protein